MTYQEAISYLNYAEKNGCSVPDYEGLPEEEVIQMARYMMDRADAEYDSWKEMFT